MVKDKMIQNDSVEVCSQNTQHHCFLIIYKRCGKSHTHTGKRHCFSQFHVEIFVHDLCHNIQSARGCISVKKNAQSYADDQDIAENIQLLTIGHGTEIRKNLFEQTKKQRKHDAGINSLYTKLFTAGKKTDDQQYHIQDHRDRRKRKRHKVG